MSAPPPYKDGNVGWNVQQPQATVHVAQPQAQVIVVGGTVFGPAPAHITCPNCQKSVTTITEEKANTMAHLACAGLCLLGCWLCCWIPYVVDAFKKVEHTCPKCQAFVGVYTSA